jgi:hypothetical protein
MQELVHPCKADIEVLRRAILAVDPSVAEGIKWNAPSYRTTEYFATTNLRAKVGIGLVLHLGAKARDLPAGGLVIADPAKMLKWLGKDRALIEFRTGTEVQERIPALQAVLREWIRYV